MKNNLIVLIFGIVIVFVIAYFLFFYNSAPSKHGTNSVEILYNSCKGCSDGALNIIKSLFHSNGADLLSKNVSFESVSGSSLVSQYSVTSLPTLIINETNVSTDTLDSLAYLNAFNVESNNFVLNTPFLAGVYKGIKYFDLIQNRSITAFDILNQSYVYKNTNTSVINPSEVLYLINGTNYTNKNKVEISFVYSNSSFSAVQSLIMYTALKAFGNFSNLSTLIAPRVAFSSSETLGDTEFYALNGSDYNSNYFYLEPSYLQNLSSSPYVNILEKQLFEFDQNSAYPLFSNIGNFMPFMDIGGRYI